MLSAQHRLRSSTAFVSALRAGKRARVGTVVIAVHPRSGAKHTQVGFAVSKAVGNSVVRHRVSRKLRAVMADRLDRVPEGAAIVVRALPEAATASSARLAADCDAALAQAMR